MLYRIFASPEVLKFCCYWIKKALQLHLYKCIIHCEFDIMANLGNKVRSILISAVLALMFCNVSGIAVYLHLHSDAAHHQHHKDCDDKSDNDCPICEQAVLNGKYYNTVAVICPSISETVSVPLETPEFYVFTNHWTESFKIRPPPLRSFC